MLDAPAQKAAAHPASTRWQGRQPSNGAGFSILLVCRANLCRSPLAEFLVRRDIEARGLPVHVSSAGTHAEPGLPMHPLARETLAARKIEPDHFLSRRLTETIVDKSSLILTMTDAQRSWVVNTYPQAVRRTYLLSQFSRLVEATPAPGPISSAEWGQSLLDRAIEGRTLAQPLFEGRDIEDPIGRPLRQFQNCARVIEQRVDPLFAGIVVKAAK